MMIPIRAVVTALAMIAVGLFALYTMDIVKDDDLPWKQLLSAGVAIVGIVWLVFGIREVFRAK